jgi:DNA polymerase I
MDIFKILDDRDQKEEKKIKRVKEKKVAVKKLSKKELELQEISKNTILPRNYTTVWREQELYEMLDFLRDQEVIALDTETTGVNTFVDRIVGFSVFAGGQGYYIPLMHKDNGKHFGDELKEIGYNFIDCLSKETVIENVKPFLENSQKKFILHNARFDQHILLNQLGIRLKPYADTMILAMLLDENRPASLKELSGIYLKQRADKFNTLFGKITFDNVPILMGRGREGNLASYYAIKDTEMTLRLYEFFIQALNNPKLEKIKKIFFEVEMPLNEIIFESEQHGILFDSNYMNEFVKEDIEGKLKILDESIRGVAGDINLKSPAQLSKVLYEDLGIKQINGKSTDKTTLNKLKGEHKVIEDILQYRKLIKLYDAFIEKLPADLINGRIHPSFNQIRCVSGRMSCSKPNMQQIPSGNLIRNSFIADEGRLLASIDYSSQEIRMLTHFSQDPILIDVFKTGKDLHSILGVKIWNNHNEHVTYEYFIYCREIVDYFKDADGNLLEQKFQDTGYVESLFNEGKIQSKDPKVLKDDCIRGKQFEKMRKFAKATTFGVIYGISKKGLSELLEMGEREAQEMIDNFFGLYKGVDRWIKKVHRDLKKNKFTETILGRKRRLYEDINSGENHRIGKAQRQGVNSIIQGSSADSLKVAVVKLQPLLKELGAKIVMYIHDECVFDVPEDIGVEGLKRIAQVMSEAIPLKNVDVTCDIEVGKKWGQKMSHEEIEFLNE